MDGKQKLPVSLIAVLALVFASAATANVKDDGLYNRNDFKVLSASAVFDGSSATVDVSGKMSPALTANGYILEWRGSSFSETFNCTDDANPSAITSFDLTSRFATSSPGEWTVERTVDPQQGNHMDWAVHMTLNAIDVSHVCPAGTTLTSSTINGVDLGIYPSAGGITGPPSTKQGDLMYYSQTFA
jgi:hypothetical protein